MASKTCPDCGGEILADAPEGLCPHCLLGQVVGASAAQDALEGERATAKDPEPPGGPGTVIVHHQRRYTITGMIVMSIALPLMVGTLVARLIPQADPELCGSISSRRAEPNVRDRTRRPDDPNSKPIGLARNVHSTSTSEATPRLRCVRL